MRKHYTKFELTKAGIKRHIKKVRRARMLAYRLKHPIINTLIIEKPVGRDITNEVLKIIKPSLAKRLWVALKAFIKFGFKPYNKITN